jgi:signal transduction histidine kinase
MNSDDLSGLADFLQAQRNRILLAWRNAIARDPTLTSSDPLPKTDLYDHIPTLLTIFETRLRQGDALPASQADAGHAAAAAHGLQRWQQGYDLREVTRELGKLNEIVVDELEAFSFNTHEAAAKARRLWASLCSTGIEESVAQYFQLQQQEAVGHMKDLEGALTQTKKLELQRADLWRQAAHDLRGNLGVVANATVGLTRVDLHEPVRDQFVRILMRNVTSLHHLLNDVTDLARLQAGREERKVETIDVSLTLMQLCDGVRPLAQQQRLFLRTEGPAGFGVDGDEVKIRRIAQNLILNALKFTREGGITVSWGDGAANDPKRWELCISDTGPGIHSGSDNLLAVALEKAQEQSIAPETATTYELENVSANETIPSSDEGVSTMNLATGEGLGLSIIKRLCDLLDATIEMTSESGVGTSFRILFPRRYSI